MQENWTQWKPIEDLINNYYIESISDSIDDGVKILLFDAQNKKRKVLISFPNSVDSYRITDESFTYLTIDFLAERYGAKFFHDCAFFKIQDSKYLQWISQQSYGISEKLNFTHFCIIAIDSIIDVIANYEPTVTIIGENE
jgi:hypothetical protein